MVVSGIMLAEAAILDGKNVVQTQSYGIASRGGFSQAEVIMDRDEIIFQNVEKPDMVLCMSEEAMEKHHRLGESGIPIFYDTTLLKAHGGENLIGYPFTELANELGNAGVANTIALGAMVRRSPMVKFESLEVVLAKKYSGHMAEVNIKGLKIGIGLGASPQGAY